MNSALDLTSYAHAFGRTQGAWRFARAELRHAATLAAVAASWDVFRRDAGRGDVGPAHEEASAAAQLLCTQDPRRDPLLLWLADYGAPPLAEAAANLARMVGATRRFGADEQALLDAARDALAHPATGLGPVGEGVAAAGRADESMRKPLRAVAGVVDRLRGQAEFREGEGAEVHHVMPSGTFSRYVSAEPAGCWALNLALLAKGAQPADVPPPPGMVARASFRSDLEPVELTSHLVENASAAWHQAYDRLSRLELELARGRNALAHLSRNARARDAWLLVAALGTCTRTQLARALGLSRAGADIQANALADAHLVTLAPGGRISWAPARDKKDVAPPPLERGPLAGAIFDLDASLAEVDRLLARDPQSVQSAFRITANDVRSHDDDRG